VDNVPLAKWVFDEKKCTFLIKFYILYFNTLPCFLNEFALVKVVRSLEGLCFNFYLRCENSFGQLQTLRSTDGEAFQICTS